MLELSNYTRILHLYHEFRKSNTLDISNMNFSGKIELHYSFDTLKLICSNSISSKSS